MFYFTAVNTGSCSDNIIAYTIICHMEPFTYRPNVAAINLCPRFWALTEPNYNKQVSALVHEMVHGLVSTPLQDSPRSRSHNQQQQDFSSSSSSSSAFTRICTAGIPPGYFQ